MSQTSDLPRLVERIDSDFTSYRLKCAGWLYRPTGVQNPPIIIMAHGFAGERAFRLPAFAEKFAQSGMAVLLFDYRNFGDSEGQPRNLVDPARHIQDWESAIAHVRSLPGINTEKIALWGTSLSGGHVITVAARQSGISAVVAQVPYVAPNKDLFELKKTIKGTFTAFWDLGKMLLGRDPCYIPVVGTPGTFAFLSTEECWDGYQAIIPEDSKWDNRVPARVLFKLAFYSPTHSASDITCPVLLVAGEHDSLIPAAMVKKVASKMSNAIYVQLSCGHFEPYVGDLFEQVVELETGFLVKQLEASIITSN